MRDYTLITGVTGLLGAYLLRDLLSRGVPCAVLARGNRMESATQRVESILTRMERETKTILPRPVVLEGSLSENLGLDAEAIAWVERRCGRILHNAASLTFERDPKTDEPYRSNVAGAKFAVEFALNCKIPQFHHVSTAYVCGLRTGVCRENELDVGQEWGNDYEKAKVEAEKIVRGAPFSEPPTIYRPAIIVGDSITGYTSTYHGFYTPLKVAAAMVDERNFRVSADDVVRLLGMNGNEHKNFVPVEWVSQAIVALASRPENVGKTFHLTPKNRPTVGDMYAVFTDALRRFGEKNAAAKKLAPTPKPTPNSASSPSADATAPDDLAALTTSFREQMKVYRSYWRDDPIFDASNFDAALPDLPCPETSLETLERLSTFALEANFGWPKPRPLVPKFFAADALASLPVSSPVSTEAARRQKTTVAISVRGPGGLDRSTTFDQNGRVVATENGIDADADAKLVLNVETLAAALENPDAARRALDAGALFWETSVPTLRDGENALRFLFAATKTKKSDKNAEKLDRDERVGKERR